MRLGNGVISFCAVFCLAFVPIWAQTPSSQQSPTPNLNPGIIIEKIVKHSEAKKAGVAEGDVLLRWSRGEASGEIQSPFDLVSIEIEQAPRGPVTLEGLHSKTKKVWTLGQSSWGIQAQPNLAEGLLNDYRQAQE